jgi:hypothetical protein
LAAASSQTGVGVLMVDGASSKDMHSCQGNELLTARALFSCQSFW